jgi:hypothetical protein
MTPRWLIAVYKGRFQQGCELILFMTITVKILCDRSVLVLTMGELRQAVIDDALAAVERRADLRGGGFNDGAHRISAFTQMA